MALSYSLSADAVERRDVLRRVLADLHDPRTVHAQILGDEAPDPKIWRRLAADMGVCAVRVPEKWGGLDLGYAEFAMVAGELGAALYSGPFWGTAVLGLSALLACAEESPVAASMVSQVAAGEMTLALAYRPLGEGPLPLASARGDDGRYAISGRTGLVVDALDASNVLVVTDNGGELGLYCVATTEVSLEARASVDPTRRLYDVTFDAARATLVAHGASVEDALDEVDRTARLAAAAEAVRGAEEALAMSVQFAKDRVQFGKPIGSFQAIKHKCANGLIALQGAKSTLSYAATALDEASPRTATLAVLAAHVAATQTYVQIAGDAIQIHGTFGYTRDALTQSYFRRARWLSLALGDAESALLELAGLVLSRDVAASDAATPELFTVRLPREDDPRRQTVRAWLDEHPQPDGQSLLDAGYMVPQWPAPYGLDADGSLVVIIDQEMRRSGAHRPPYPLAREFIAPLLATSGTPSQQVRYIASMLSGRDIWCELFSEPESGSDLASLSTTAVRDGDGYLVNGVKTWTSQAHVARYGLLLARTDPEAAKHRGISCFIVPMDNPGISLQPIQSMEGDDHWCLTFLDDVRLSSDDLVGEENQGWQIAMSVLANERLMMSATPGLLWGEGPSFADLLDLCRERENHVNLPEHLRLRLMQGYVEALALHVMRIESMAGGGNDLVPEVRRALADMHGQSMLELWRDLYGERGVQWSPTGVQDDPWAANYFAARSLTLGGGTSEIQRNILGERVLGLPRS